PAVDRLRPRMDRCRLWSADHRHGDLRAPGHLGHHPSALVPGASSKPSGRAGGAGHHHHSAQVDKGQSMIFHTPPPVLAVEDVKVHYGGVHAVDGVSFEVNPGELVGIVGPNGSGKTTLVNAITALTHITSGEIRVNGTAVTKLAAARIARLGVRR